jgi:hypothetical protein
MEARGAKAMTRITIYSSYRFDVVSYGNGLSYAIHDKINSISAFVQGDDANEFRADLEAYPEDLPFDEFYAEQIAIREWGTPDRSL